MAAVTDTILEVAAARSVSEQRLIARGTYHLGQWLDRSEARLHDLGARYDAEQRCWRVPAEQMDAAQRLTANPCLPIESSVREAV